jgi:8-hydroxy-5-deazaflavin:NADPH oxidoreductase
MVGNTISTKLIQLGHFVKMGSRTVHNQKAVEWANKNGKNASEGTFSNAAEFGEIIFNCTSGLNSIAALKSAGSENLKNKILIDIANPLDFSKGMPATLGICNNDSLGEQIQKIFPETKVVKTLNTMNCSLQVNPSMIPGDHDTFLSGNDEAAKNKVKEILTDWFGWKSVIDLGDIKTARGTEMLLPIWLSLMTKFGNPDFNFRIVRKNQQ